MPTLGRDPIIRGILQSDLDGGADATLVPPFQGYKFLGVQAVGDIQNATLHVDPSLSSEFGVRGTGLPFQTLAAAVAAARPGDTIILRPGTHAFDGAIDIFQLAGLTILGHGAIITSDLEVNETIKFTVRSGSVTFEGIEFDGAVTDTPVVTGSGCIEVSAPGFTVRDCFVHHQNGYGIHFLTDYDGARVFDCDIEFCLFGIYAEETNLAPTRDTEGFWVKRSNFERNRKVGIALVGPGPDSGFFLSGIQISDNVFSRNDTDVAGVFALSCSYACTRVQIDGNRIMSESNGIGLSQVKGASISNNNLRDVDTVGIELVGCIGYTISDNIVDSRNSAGTPTTTSPLLILGQYAAPNDAGQGVITGNAFLFPKTAANSISISNAGAIVLNSNRIEGTIVLAALVSVMVNGNLFSIPQTSQAILIDASNRGSSKISIVGNRFNFVGASINRCVTTVDASATGIDDVLIEGNATPTGQTFGIATYGHSGSNPATRVVMMGNTPESATFTVGWRNSGVPFNQVLVSQTVGTDATGLRGSRTSKFKTINAAITAASSGDTVVVEDGTFNELLSAKNGVTVRFMPAATLRCTSAGGCIVSSADNQAFTVYHEHEAIECTQNTTTAVSWTHAGAYLALHASINQTGAGVLPLGLRVSDGTVEVWGYVYSLNSKALSMAAGGAPTVIVHGGLSGNYDIQSGTGTALEVLGGDFRAYDAKILGGDIGASFNTSVAAVIIFKRCTITSLGTGKAAIEIVAVGSTKPILRDCVLVSDDTATKAINVGSAQTIILNGQTCANKGADPPTNVTFTGGGTYDVSADVVGN